MKSFESMGLPEALNKTLRQMQFNDPTPIQAEAIPLALEGKDILGSAQTGTGKTGAFGIPLVAKLINNPNGAALVMTPTRELASQVMNQLKALLGEQSMIKHALLIGGDSIPKQLQQLRRRPRLIVGTPGRINDHIKRGTFHLKHTDFLVLDETDRMLDMGFTIQIENILQGLSAERQTLLFSATMPQNIVCMAEKYLNNPSHVAVSSTSAPAANIQQESIYVSEAEKYQSLITQLDARGGSIIIFIKTKSAADRMALKLFKEGHDAQAIHGDLRQQKRERVMNDFRNKKYRILVATDVAARGLDILHIEHVINYDLPQCPEDYVHRIGRTARAGAAGFALNLITPADKGKWNAIDRILNPDRPVANDELKKDSKKVVQGRRRKRRF
ncbi:DEAD/DEAH box helicase [Candidatus Cyrtobacter comes]|uniref:DEAD/DEAH box helicase n=1 Tax=Candidatus Cyrtobacter comes TaxID=675776 RepID=A0ABU5L9J7_9RICK|nr:DEAD/DEAH box helicase [Candidatus Cyrtobacter comes]MDZ5762794.1 DEAD/DEAH box helicase [Candidatus Cyrtobacter comes]